MGTCDGEFVGRYVGYSVGGLEVVGTVECRLVGVVLGKIVGAVVGSAEVRLLGVSLGV